MAPTTVLAGTRDFFQREAPLGSQSPYEAPVRPGMLLVIDANGEALPHDTAGALPAPLYVAIEDVRPPDGGGVDSFYSEEGEAVHYHIALSGDRMYFLLAAGQDVAAGAVLTSNGDGYVKAVGGGTAVCKALEAVDNNPGTDSEPAWILAEVI